MEHELNNQLTQRVRNSTLFIPIHPEIIEADFEGYANLNLINILAENTGFKKA